MPTILDRLANLEAQFAAFEDHAGGITGAHDKRLTEIELRLG